VTVSRIVRARTLAQELVLKHDLQPPVPILDLLDEVAEVSALPWPQSDVDALIPELGKRRPQVFYRSGAPELRQRFTLAHEYGHIQMLWHGAGQRSCVSGENSADLISVNDEQEADLFASTLMAPDGWLQQRRHEAGGDMSALVASLDDLQLSAVASVRALRRVIMAGWVFRLGEYTFNSSGTATDWRYASERDLREASRAHAAVTLQGRRVRWYRMFGDERAPDADDDPRTTTDILRDALTRLDASGRMDDDPISLSSVNGKIGGSTNRITGTVDEVYQHLVYRFNEDRYEVLLEDPEFRMYLARKARAIASGATKSGKRRQQSKR
jgi:hypothetical protein